MYWLYNNTNSLVTSLLKLCNLLARDAKQSCTVTTYLNSLSAQYDNNFIKCDASSECIILAII